MISTWARWYWPLWLSLMFAAFLGPEVYALVTNWRNTLSETVWTWLDVQRGQRWTALHAIVCLVVIALLVWLVVHLFWRRWT